MTPAGRRRTHSEEDILRAVRDLLLDHGPRGVTTAAVSERSGAPTGSLYHRFGSRSIMVAELWIRTIGRFHVYLLEVVDDQEPGLPRALAFAKAVIDFSARNTEDARLMLIASRDEAREGRHSAAGPRRGAGHLECAGGRDVPPVVPGAVRQADPVRGGARRPRRRRAALYGGPAAAPAGPRPVRRVADGGAGRPGDPARRMIPTPGSAAPAAGWRQTSLLPQGACRMGHQTFDQWLVARPDGPAAAPRPCRSRTAAYPVDPDRPQVIDRASRSA